MTTWRKVQGDVNDTITVVLSGVESLVAATAIAKVWRKNVASEDLTATITSAPNRTLAVDLGGSSGWLSDAEPGTWLIEYQLLFVDGTVLTWPALSPDLIVVRADA